MTGAGAAPGRFPKNFSRVDGVGRVMVAAVASY
jgi:hypothetical protein